MEIYSDLLEFVLARQAAGYGLTFGPIDFGGKMSTTPNPTISALLQILESANGYVSLGVTVAGVAVPLIKGLIAKIEGIGTGSVSISFTDLLAQDAAELDAITKLSEDDLSAVNAELTRLGFPTLPAPAPPPAPAPATEPGGVVGPAGSPTPADPSAPGPTETPKP